MAILLF